MKKFNKKHIFKIVSVGLLATSLSCSDDYLIDQKYDGLTSDIVYSDPTTAQATVTSIYDALQMDIVEGNMKGLLYPNTYSTLDFYNIGSDTFYNTYEVPTDFGGLNQLWIKMYSGIVSANNAIYNIQNMIEAGNIDADLGNRLVGESLALRGVYYSILASNFGGVPLVTGITSTSEESLYTARSTEEEVFQQVVSDLEAAVDLLPWSYTAENIGRITKGAAEAYLGNAYMWQGNYSDAIAAYETLDGHYTLESDYLNIHDYDNRNGIESIFEIQMYSSSGAANWGGNDDNMNFFQWFTMPIEIQTYGGYTVPTEAFFDSFESGDTRRDATLIGPDMEHPDPDINISDYPMVQANYGGINTCGTSANPWAPETRSGYYLVKYWRNPLIDASQGNIFSDQNLILLRYADVLLSLSEAHYRLGNTSTAEQYLMQVRNRAGLTNLPSGDLLDAILEEYRHEFGGEFSTWWLLRRSGEHEDYIFEHFGITIPAGKDIMPIPQQQMDANPNLVQNPSY
ncbi:membrane protein [Neptunitalea chrysea]|uniref:Membrane protein n=1 Tax=Neptunitalea chrysea TaxID=1647581 RepID=A0A9W6EWA3_9FLAO|nr:RagB/SusD family nutrient uptake outer membrane protein [Neptunitalea chrysea]GLB52658.1 membrane protein [Neptunitalea chrysea]